MSRRSWNKFLRAMGTELTLPSLESGSNKRPALRLWFAATVVAITALILWLAWPGESGIDPSELSRADGRCRFWATAYPRIQPPPNLPLGQRVFWAWMEFKKRHGKPNPAAYSFPATPVQFCSIGGLLNQCMEVAGTHRETFAGGRCLQEQPQFGGRNSKSQEYK